MKSDVRRMEEDELEEMEQCKSTPEKEKEEGKKKGKIITDQKKKGHKKNGR